MLTSYLPITIVLIAAVGLATVLTIVASAIGPKRHSPEKNAPYECGVDPESAPTTTFNIQFYRIALLFLVFDIEAAFFYPWAVLFRKLSCGGTLNGTACLGPTTFFGIGVMFLFMVILLLALVYVWRKKALEWA